MEENILSQTPFPTTATPQAANDGGAIELIWPSVANTSVNMAQDGRTAWTEQKHNSYLNNLEVSFVEQLLQLKSSSARCSDENQRDKFTVLRNGCWKNINYGREEPAYRSSADSCDLLMNPWINRLRRSAAKSPVPSGDNKELLLFHSEKKGKGTISHGATNQFAISNSENEGSGQNFLDEGNKNTTNIESRAKRLKTVSVDSSHTDQSFFQTVPENFNSSLYPPP